MSSIVESKTDHETQYIARDETFTVSFSDALLTEEARVFARIPVGTALSDLFAALGDNFDLVHIEHNGKTLTKELIVNVYPKRDDLVTIHLVPQQNEYVRMGIMIIIAVVATWVAGPGGFSAAMGIDSSFGVAMTGAVLAAAGAMAFNALVPLDIPDESPATRGLMDLSAPRNTIGLWNTVPMVFGRMRVYPPYAANPYTDSVDDDMYINALFALCVQEGSIMPEVSEVKIGDTPITNFEGVDFEITRTPEWLDVTEEDVNIEMGQPAGQFPGTSTNFTTLAGTRFCGVDLAFPSGLNKTDEDGDTNALYVDFHVEYRAAGSTGAWTTYSCQDRMWEGRNHFQNIFPFFDETLLYVNTHTARGTIVVNGIVTQYTVSSGANVDWEHWLPGENRDHWQVRRYTWNGFRMTLPIIFPSAAAWEVRVTRQLTREPSYPMGQNTMDESWGSWRRSATYCIMTKTRFYQNTRSDLIVPRDQDIIYGKLRIKASNQLQGRLDQFNCLILHKPRNINYAGTAITWQNVPIGTDSMGQRNPAWAVLDVLLGRQNARPCALSDIDAPAFFNWAWWCFSNNFAYDDVITDQRSVWDTIRTICAVGRAEFTLRDGKYSVIMDNSATAPVQIFTEENTTEFKGTRLYIAEFHGVQLRYPSERDGYRITERTVYAPGYTINNATKFEVLQLRGITRDDQAWREANRFMAIARLRPEQFQFNVDIEHILCQRGDTVLLQNYGSAFLGHGVCRVQLATGAYGFYTDERITLPSQGPLRCRIRYAGTGGAWTELVATITNTPGASTTIVYTNVAIPATMNGMMVLWGTADEEYLRCKVLGVLPQNELSATLKLVPESSAIYTADTGTIPPYDPLITAPPEVRDTALGRPRITGSSSRLVSQIPNADGSYRIRIVFTYALPTIRSFSGADIQLRYRKEGEILPGYPLGNETPVKSTGEPWTTTGWHDNTGSIIARDVTEQHTYVAQVRYRLRDGRVSLWSAAYTHVGGQDGTDPNEGTVGGDIVESYVSISSYEAITAGVRLLINTTYMQIRNASHIEIAYGTINDRNNLATKRLNLPITRDLRGTLVLEVPLALPDDDQYYVWVRIWDTLQARTAWSPTSSTAGVVVQAVLVSVWKMEVTTGGGWIFQNGAGTKRIQVTRTRGGEKTYRTTGNIRMYRSGTTTLVGDGYIWDNINVGYGGSDEIAPGGSIDVELKDITTNPVRVYELQTIADILSGAGTPGADGLLAIAVQVGKYGFGPAYVDAGSLYVHGFSGGVAADVPGRIQYGGLIYTVGASTPANPTLGIALKPLMPSETGYTSATKWAAYICFDTNPAGGFGGANNPRVCIITKVSTGATWQHRAHQANGAPGGVLHHWDFTPTATMIVIGTVDSNHIRGVDGWTIDNATIFSEGVTLGSVGEAGATRNTGALADLDTVGAGQIDAGAINDIAKFGSGLQPIKIVATTSLLTTGALLANVVYVEADRKLYRYLGTGTGPSAWTTAVSGTDIPTGGITSTHIGDLQITTPKLAANAVQATQLDANAVTADKILAGSVTAAKVAGQQITADKMSVGFNVDVLNANADFIDDATLAVGTVPDPNTANLLSWYSSSASMTYLSLAEAPGGGRVADYNPGTAVNASITSGPLVPLSDKYVYVVSATVRDTLAGNGGLYIGVQFFDRNKVLIPTTETGGAGWYGGSSWWGKVVGGGAALTFTDYMFKFGLVDSTALGTPTSLGTVPVCRAPSSVKPAFARLVLLTNYNPTTVSRVQIDNFQIIRATQGVTIEDDAITAPKIKSNEIVARHILAAAVTVDKLSTVMTSDNLVVDGDSLTDPRAWQAGDGFLETSNWTWIDDAQPAGINVDVSIVPPIARKGVYAIRATGLQSTCVRTHRIPIDYSYDRLILDVLLLQYDNVGTNTTSMRVAFFDAAGALITTAVAGYLNSNTGKHAWGIYNERVYDYFWPQAFWKPFTITIGRTIDSVVSAEIPVGAVSMAVYAQLLNSTSNGTPSTVYMQSLRVRKLITGVMIEGGAVQAKHILAEAVEADKLKGTLILSTKVLTAAESAAPRVEIAGGSAYPLWAGANAKTAGNALFYVSSSGNLFAKKSLLDVFAKGTRVKKATDSAGVVLANITGVTSVYDSELATADYYTIPDSTSSNWFCPAYYGWSHPDKAAGSGSWRRVAELEEGFFMIDASINIYNPTPGTAAVVQMHIARRMGTDAWTKFASMYVRLDDQFHVSASMHVHDDISSLGNWEQFTTAKDLQYTIFVNRVSGATALKIASYSCRVYMDNHGRYED